MDVRTNIVQTNMVITCFYLVKMSDFRFFIFQLIGYFFIILAPYFAYLRIFASLLQLKLYVLLIFYCKLYSIRIKFLFFLWQRFLTSILSNSPSNIISYPYKYHLIILLNHRMRRIKHIIRHQRYKSAESSIQLPWGVLDYFRWVISEFWHALFLRYVCIVSELELIMFSINLNYCPSFQGTGLCIVYY